jgi:TolA-binding protein
MRLKHLSVAIVLALLVALIAPLSSQEVVTPGASDSGSSGGSSAEGGGQGKSAGGISIMTAEQGEALQNKVEKLLEDQKKLLEKIEVMQKDIQFIKAASRTR